MTPKAVGAKKAMRSRKRFLFADCKGSGPFWRHEWRWVRIYKRALARRHRKRRRGKVR